MEISFKGKYRSIENLTWKDIPQLVVITGKNGTGKSQLLDLFRAAINRSWETNNNNTPIPEITGENYRKEDLVYLKGEWPLSNIGAIGLNTIQEEREHLHEQFQMRISEFAPMGDDLEEFRRRSQNNPHHTTLFEFFDSVIEKYELHKGGSIEREVFFNLIPRNLTIDLQQQATNKEIGKIFYNYRLELLTALSQGMTEKEFITKHGEKPWVLINNLFEEIELPFRLNDPENTNIKDMYVPKLKKMKGDSIMFSELSSGEKVLVSLVFWLFNSKDKGIFPKILLLDEPDAHLHPSMTWQFLYILDNVLCKEFGVRVIMTTHSSSTVAIAPENALFIMTSSEPRIKKTGKDSALGILTSGVPSFSVNYENRRQIFVESPNDVLFYENIYHKISEYLIPEISLSFISSGESRTDKTGAKVANCEQVKNISTILWEAGNKFVGGIIDYDGKNKTNEYIKVLGDGNRYAIENYLFDPVLVAALLLREKFIERKVLGLDEKTNISHFPELSRSNIQDVSDYVVNLVKQKVNPNTNLELKSVKYLGGQTVEIPKWYLMCQGHELESALLKAFPKLNAIKKDKEERLKLEIINKVLDDIPDFIPSDFLEAFQFLQQEQTVENNMALSEST